MAGPQSRLWAPSAAVSCRPLCGAHVPPGHLWPAKVEPDPAERYGAETTVPEWRKRLVCSQCGSHEMVVTEPSGDSGSGGAGWP
jgi:hypothetical protein